MAVIGEAVGGISGFKNGVARCGGNGFAQSRFEFGICHGMSGGIEGVEEFHFGIGA